VSVAQQVEQDEINPPDGDVPGASPATRRVLAALYRDAIPYTLKLLPPEANTPESVAAACDCELPFIVLSAMFRGKATKKPYLLLHSAASPINEKLLGTTVGENLARADAESALRITGFPLEAIPPVALLNRVPIMMDSAVTRFARIWVPAGSADAMVSVPTLVLARAISARLIRLDA
jgi:prolyl-tRNA editing enzyme YbaK/EbsC (Cys-tRNA(Pro) deacylase)